MTSKLSLALASAAALTFAGAAAAAETTTETRTEIHKTAHVVVLDRDAAAAAGTEAPHQIVVTSRAIDGGEPSLQVKMLSLEGLDGEAIDIGSLEEGETRTLTTASGKDVVVTRGEEGVTLSVDGKEIQLPSIMGVTAGSGTRVAFAHAAGDGGAWTPSGDKHEVIVLGGAPHAFLPSPMALAGNFDQLESLQGLEPEVREKVVAALKEIFAAHHGAMAVTTQVPATGDATTATPGHRVMVRRVITDDKAAQVE